MSKDKPKTKPCPACGGKGTVPFGTEEFTCVDCGGTGKVKSG